MPVQPTYPGLYIEELPSSAHPIVAAPTSITVFVGYVHPFLGECAERGRWKQAIRVLDTDDYDRVFGGVYRNQVLGNCDVGHAVRQFFANGGSDAIVVGLQARYHEIGGAGSGDITGASDSLLGIKFTAKEVTDARHRVVVTIRNVRRRNPADATQPLDLADIMVTFGNRLETFRDVRVRAGNQSVRDGLTNATLPTFDPDFIDNKLRGSRLVKVEPSGTEYLAAYDSAWPASRQESRELIDMPPPSFAGAPTTYNAQDFVDAFARDGSLDKQEIFNLLVVPGVADSAVWSEGLRFCEDKRAMFIMDPPQEAAADSRDGLPEIKDLFAGTLIPKSHNAAIYFPYLTANDPITGDTFELPPSGYVAGVYARTDLNRGVWKAPAGLETTVLGSTGIVDRGKMTDMRQGLLNPDGINVLRSFPGAGTVVWGARTTVAKNPAFAQWKYVPVRRMALFLEQTLLRNLGWVVFEPNDEPLWSAIRSSIEAFMLSLFRQRAFQGSTPSEAFLVKCDKGTTTQQDIDTGIVNIVVGFRPLKPAEFVIIKIAQLAGQVQT